MKKESPRLLSFGMMEKIVDQFSSLINPQREIQPFVERLTGINSKMLSMHQNFSRSPNGLWK